MFRTIQRKLALSRLVRAQAELNAYQSQPADGQWIFAVAYALQYRKDSAASAYLALTTR